MTRAAAVTAGGLALIAIALILTLSGSPLVVNNVNGTQASGQLVEASGGAGACQSGEELAAGISAVRLGLASAAGPRVSVTVFSGTHVVTTGVADSGWTSGDVTVPVKSLPHTSFVKVCFKLGSTVESVRLNGSRTSPSDAATSLSGEPLPGRFTIEYMRPGDGSWWSRVSTVAMHMGLGRAPSGTWIAVLILVLMVVTVAIGSALAVKELR